MESKRGKIMLWALTAAILGGCVWALYATGFFEAAGSPEQMGAYIARCAPWSHLAYFGVQLVSVIVAPIPSNITAAAGAYLFGLWPSFLLTWGAVAAGSALVFALARALGQGFASRFVSEKLSEKYLDLIRRKRDVFLALAFLFPFFPDDLLCILAGLTSGFSCWCCWPGPGACWWPAWWAAPPCPSPCGAWRFWALRGWGCSCWR